jgi:hypothetical protein
MDTLIPLHWVELANQKWLDHNKEGFPSLILEIRLDISFGRDFGRKFLEVEESCLGPEMPTSFW